MPVPPAEKNHAGESNDKSFVLKYDQAQEADESHHRSIGVLSVPNLPFVGHAVCSFGLIP